LCLLIGDSERWRCYVCDPKPLLGLIEQCTAIMEALARQEKLESDKRRKPDANSRPISTMQYHSSSVKTAAGTKLPAQPVSVIQTASIATIGKYRMQPYVDAAKQQPARMTNRTIATLLSEQQPLQGKPVSVTTKTVASLLAERREKPGVTMPASSKAQVTTSAASSTKPAHAHVQNVVTSQNVLIVLDRLLSATNSMNVFLQSLKMDARKNAVGITQAHYEKRREIAGKLTRAYAAYTRSFQEVTTYTSPSQNAATVSQVARANTTKASTVVMRAPAATNSATATSASRPVGSQRSVLSRPPIKSVSSEVIEISDSDDDRGCASVVKGKSKLPSTSVVIPVMGRKITEGQLVAAVRTKVLNQNAPNLKKRSHSPDTAAGHSSSHVAEKRVCVDGGGSESSPRKPLTSVDDGAMFDGSVEEIPHDDVGESSDNHQLQMDCVDVNEDSDDSDTPLSDIKLANGKVPTVSATTASERPIKQRSFLEAELTRNMSSRRSVVS